MSLDRRVLIADDDVHHRKGVADLLAGLGLEILQAATGAEALSLLRAGALDLALLDQRMPEHTGLDVLVAVRAEVLRVPCILCSGELDGALERRAREAGATAVLRKPVRPDVLRSAVLAVLTEVPPLGHDHPPPRGGEGAGPSARADRLTAYLTRRQ